MQLTTIARRASLGSALIGAVATAGVLSTRLEADDEDPIVGISARQIFIPKGFDSNDGIEVVVDGYLPSTCYKLAEPKVDVDMATKTVHLLPQAYMTDPPCLRMLVPYTQTVQLGRLQAAGYTVALRNSSVNAPLPVAQARASSQDDSLYAPVDRVTVKYADVGQPSAVVLEGRLTSSCLDWESVEVQNHGDTFEVLPVLVANGDDCEESDRPFEKVVPLPEITENGRYLLHVRVMSGKSINVVFPRF